MRKVNWASVEEAGNYPRPVPGGYIAVITNVQDVEEKEYLRISWDFAEGDLKGNNRDTALKFGNWPMDLFRSYKESALGFFKTFKGHLEKSNPGYLFDEGNLPAMRGKLVGVILGEEEYISNKGEKKTRLIVVTTKTIQEIREGSFTIPPLKKLEGDKPVYSAPADNTIPDGPMPWDNPNTDPGYNDFPNPFD